MHLWQAQFVNAGSKQGEFFFETLAAPMLDIDRQGDQRVGGRDPQNFIKRLGADMAGRKRAGTDQTGIAVVGHRETVGQIASKKVTVNALLARNVEHLRGYVGPVDRRYALRGKRRTAKPGSGPKVQHRTCAAVFGKQLCDLGRKLVIHVLGEAAVVAVRPIGIEPLAVVGCAQCISAFQIWCCLGHHAIGAQNGHSRKAWLDYWPKAAQVLRMTQTLLSFGHGYSARALARLLLPDGWRVIGTTRSEDKLAGLRDTGAEALRFPGDDLRPALAEASHLLISAGPNEQGDPVLGELHDAIAEAAPRLSWVGYLSTTGVYGDHGGGWVDETTPIAPTTRRGKWRKAAEDAWLSVPDLPVHVFRLAGIYGPGRGPFAKVRAGTAKRVIKQGQVFSRTHVEDIGQVLRASIAQPNPGRVYNVCDDDPAPPQDVIAYAAELLGLPLPPEVDFETAEMHPMARSFYSDSKRVRNDRIKDELGVVLKYPDYHSGLKALLAEEKAQTT